MIKFTIDRPNKIIGVDYDHWNEIDEIEDWCKENGDYTVYVRRIEYRDEKDLTLFVLRWL